MPPARFRGIALAGCALLGAPPDDLMRYGATAVIVIDK
jgi:hypothetical protein